MIAAASRTIIVVDSTKFDRNAFAHVAPLSSIQVLVTDAEPPAALREALDAEDIEIIVAT